MLIIWNFKDELGTELISNLINLNTDILIEIA